MKTKFMIVAFALLLMATSVLAAPMPATFKWVKLNGDILSPTSSNSIQSVNKDDSVKVRVSITVDSNAAKLNDLQIEATIRGYDHTDLIEDITEPFNALPGRTYTKELSLKLPIRMDHGTYKLRVRVVDADHSTLEQTYELEVESDSHAIWIKDIVLDPNTVAAGRATIGKVRLENVGNVDENDGIKVEMSIPELGVGPVVDYIDSLDEGHSVSTEELFLRIPKCTKEGSYDVLVKVTYRDGDETTTGTTKLHVIESEACPQNNETTSPSNNKNTNNNAPAVTVTAAIQSQRVQIGGKGTIYPLTIKNTASESRTVTITPVVSDWGSALVSPSNVFVLNAGETQTAYVYVTAADDATPGSSVFAVTVSVDGNVVDQKTLTAVLYQNNNKEPTVIYQQGSSLKQTLEIVLVVVLILLILLGLVIGFKKLSSSDSEDEDEESYY